MTEDKAAEQSARTQSEQPNGNSRKVPRERAKKAMKATLEIVRKLGGGAGELWKRLRKTKSPQEMIDELAAGLDANRQRRETVSARIENLHARIVAKKQEHASAGKARQRILEAELRSLLAEYKTAERELNVLLENERVLSQVCGRMNEMLAYDLAGVSEDLIDDVALDIEEKAAEADGRLDASRDLEKAGRRRSREADGEGLWDALSEFDEESTAAATTESQEKDRVKIDISEELQAFESELKTEPSAPTPPEPERE